MLLLATSLALQLQRPTPVAPRLPAPAFSLAAGDFVGGPTDEIVVVGQMGVAMVRFESTGERWIVDPIEASPSFAGAEALRALDVDSDGRLDLIHALGIVFNDTEPLAPTFRADVRTGGFDPQRLVGVVDLDGNGLGDLLFTSPLGGRLRVSYQTSARTFTPLSWLPVDPCEAAVLGDFDNDGVVDLAVLTEGRLQVWRNDGSALPWPVVHDAPAGATTWRSAMIAEDLDQDGALDLVTSANDLRVFAGVGDGTFTEVQNFGVEPLMNSLHLVDLDGDGDRDLVLWTEESQYWAFGTLKRAERTGPLTFAAPTFDLATSEQYRDIAFADVDGDGLQECIGARGVGYSVSISDLPLAPGEELSVEGIAVAPFRVRAIAQMDLDSDGDLDLVSATEDGLITSERVASDALRSLSSLSIPLHPDAPPIAAGDFGIGSGGDDVAVVSLDGELVLFGDLEPGAQAARLVIGDGLRSTGDALAAIDIDADGDLDLIALRMDGSAVVVFERSATGFAAPRVVVSALPGESLESFATGDWSGDGSTDLVTIERAQGAYAARAHEAVTTGGAGGGFVPGATSIGLPGPPLRARVHTAGGAAELLVTIEGSSEVLAHRFQPNATLDPAYVALDVAPLEALDVLVIDRGSFAALHVLAGTGPPGGFPSVLRLFRTTQWPSSVAPAELPVGAFTKLAQGDVDADAVPDLLLYGARFDGVATTALTPTAATGEVYCDQTSVNSTGEPAQLRLAANHAGGSPAAPVTDLRVDLVALPAGATTMLLVARTPALLPGAGGALGTLCLGGTVGRLNGPGQVRPAGAFGTLGLELDPSALPLGGSTSAAFAGELWTFQAWYRDVDAGGAPASRFTNAVAVVF